MIRAIEPVAQVGDRSARPAWTKKAEIPEGFGEQLAESIRRNTLRKTIPVEAIERAQRSAEVDFWNATGKHYETSEGTAQIPQCNLDAAVAYGSCRALDDLLTEFLGSVSR